MGSSANDLIQLRPTLPNEARAVGAIYVTTDPRCLVDGMLFVTIVGSKFKIDVSWYPEHDPNGEYYITLYGKNYEFLANEFYTRDPYKAVSIVEQWVDWVLKFGMSYK